MNRWLKSLIYRLRSEVCTEDLIARGLKVGSNFYRQEKCIIDQSHCWLITIGDNVTFAPCVHVLAHDASTKMHLGYTRIGRVNIGNNVFIGAASVILPNVTIGDNVIIGANSTVTKDVPANSVAAGTPARIICSLEELLLKCRKEMESAPIYEEDFTELRSPLSNEKKQQQYQELAGRIGFIR